MKYDPAQFAAATQSPNKDKAAKADGWVERVLRLQRSQINWNRSLQRSQPVGWQRDLYQLWIRSGSTTGIEP